MPTTKTDLLFHGCCSFAATACVCLPVCWVCQCARNRTQERSHDRKCSPPPWPLTGGRCGDGHGSRSLSEDAPVASGAPRPALMSSLSPANKPLTNVGRAQRTSWADPPLPGDLIAVQPAGRETPWWPTASIVRLIHNVWSVCCGTARQRPTPGLPAHQQSAGSSLSAGGRVGRRVPLFTHFHVPFYIDRHCEGRLSK